VFLGQAAATVAAVNGFAAGCDFAKAAELDPQYADRLKQFREERRQ